MGVPAIGVAHHHAYIAALCAEHAVDGPLLGLVIDGVGLGPDGGLWGGELLRVHAADCQRLGHLLPLPLPGGERAAREPWRLAVAALYASGHAAQVEAWLAATWPGRDSRFLLGMLERHLRCPPTSSLGRWFDAAALLGVRAETHYEGQAAMELEGLAARHGPLPALSDGFILHPDGVLDLTPLVPALLGARDPGRGAALFHATLAALGDALPRTVAVGGGCAMNRILVDALRGHLAAAGVSLLEARQAPPNDGGLALGQAWVARQVMGACG